MEWLVLILLVPAILVPVVLLWGFAGCSFDPQPADLILAPTNVSAAGVSVSAIALTWDNPNTDPVTFQVERTKEGESSPQILSSSSTTLQDAGLQEATTYFYKVKAIRTSDNQDSELSEQAAGRTIGVAFEAGLTTDQAGLEGFCVVQRIEPTRLRQSTVPGGISTPGARVRITVRGSTAASLTLDRVYISQPAASGDPYDSAADLTPVDSGIVVPANTAVALPDVDYDLDKARPLLIAFDISAAAGSGNVRFVTNVPEAEAVMFFSPATIEASINDRSPSAANPGGASYVTSKSIYLVEKIEVV
jgi:hypothetical protein